MPHDPGIPENVKDVDSVPDDTMDIDETPELLSYPDSDDEDVTDCGNDDSTTYEVKAYLKEIFGSNRSSDSDESKAVDVAVVTVVDSAVDTVVVTAANASTSAPDGNISNVSTPGRVGDSRVDYVSLGDEDTEDDDAESDVTSPYSPLCPYCSDFNDFEAMPSTRNLSRDDHRVLGGPNWTRPM